MLYQPAHWLYNLSKKAPKTDLPWRQSLRLALVTSIPLLIGFLTGDLTPTILICLGGFLTTLSLTNAPYHTCFHRLTIILPFGMAGYFLGGLLAAHGLWTIAGIVLISFISGLISSYGAVFALGCMQLLIMTVVSAHAAPTAGIWVMPAFFLLGGVLSAILLKIESKLFPNRPEIELLSKLLKNLSEFANISADKNSEEKAIRKAQSDVLQAQLAAYQALIHTQSQQDGRTQSETQIAEILAITDRLTALIASRTYDTAILKQVTGWLNQMSASVTLKIKIDVPEKLQHDNNSLLYNLNSLNEILYQYGTKTPDDYLLSFSKLMKSSKTMLYNFKANLIFGRHVVNNALRLSFCMLLALIAEHIVPGQRSYWLPLTVAVIMKSDAGSIYVRAVHRSLGTIVGVIVAIAVFAIFPKNISLVAVVFVFSLTIPWAGAKSYAWQCAVMTPLILILIDLLVPGPTANYGLQRMADTLMGAGVVLFFGYWIWPKTAPSSIRKEFSAVLKLLASYLERIEITSADNKSDKSVITDSADIRQQVYKNLSDLRSHVQLALAEPSPVSDEARAWVPAIAAAERIADGITTFASLSDQKQTATNIKDLQQTIQVLQSLIQKNNTIETKVADRVAPPLANAASKILFDIQENAFSIRQLTVNNRVQPA
ncbi:FUSC family protein [Paenochrobactrum pullorum]|uniref:FUSC family protein n=1 Tax=Paenochrobactrum pullorum TaxID=1324351 RepID=UPI0035BBDAE5